MSSIRALRNIHERETPTNRQSYLPSGSWGFSFTSRGLGTSSGRFCRSRQCGLCRVMYSLHDPFPDLFRLISQQLSLPTDELGLDLREFLWLFHTNELVSKVERI